MKKKPIILNLGCGLTLMPNLIDKIKIKDCVLMLLGWWDNGNCYKSSKNK